MDEEATQPATQPLPGHEGAAPSSVNSNYLAGVICLLHPSSPAAFAAVERLSRIKPTHVLKIPDNTRTPNVDSDVAIPEANPECDDDDDDDDDDEPATQLATPGQVCDEEGLDIALRSLPGPKDPEMGFMFGRNPHRCDIVIGETSKTRRISNTHFRIFQNQKGVLMLEDFSTNGTWVDHVKLGGTTGGGGEADHSNGNKHALFAGSIIYVAPGDELLRFVVRIPNQSGSGLCPSRTPAEGSIISRSITGVGIDPGPAPQPAAPKVAPHLRPTVPRSPHKNLAAIRRTPGPLKEHEMHTSISVQKDLGWNGGGIYKVEGIIGAGAFATVKRGILKKTGEVFAIKMIQKRAFANQGNMGGKATGVRKEVEILEKLHHPNIVGCTACYEDVQHIYIVMEFVGGGDLNEYLKKNHRMREDMVQEVSRQVLRGIEYVHSMGISHRDLKPDNILMVKEEPLSVKISDFGLAKMVQSEETFLKTFCGTMLYLAPEVYPSYATALVVGANSFKRKRNPREEAGREDGRSAKLKRRYNQAVDMWSLGCVIHMLLTGKAPFEGKNQDDMLRLILKGYTNTSLLEKFLGRGCDDVKDFIKRLLQVNPAMRMMEQEALNHIWLKNGSDISSSSMEVEEDEVIYREDDEYQMVEGEMAEKWTKVPSSTPNRWADSVDVSDGEEESTPRPEDALSGAVRNMSFQPLKPTESMAESHDDDSISGSFLSLDNAESQIGSKMFRRPPDISIQGSSGVFPEDEPSLYSTASVGLPDNVAPSDESFKFDKRAEFASQAIPSSNTGQLQVKDSTGSGDSLSNTEAMVGNLRVVSPAPGEEQSRRGNEKMLQQQRPNGNKLAVQKDGPRKEVSNISSFDDPAVVYSTPLSLMAPAESVPATPEPSRNVPNPENHLPLSQPCNVQSEAGNFIKPNTPWGKLVPVAGSIPHNTIYLNRQMITIGRSSTCTHVQTDIRISKTHFAMMLADPSLSVQPPNDTNWCPQPHMIAWFKVAGTNGCLLNGKKKRKDGIGRIYNGDIIHLFKDTSNDKNDYLAFRCELKIGEHHRYEPELSDEDMSVRQKSDTAQHVYSMGISMATTMAIASPFGSHEEEFVEEL